MVICLASPFAWLCASVPLIIAYYSLIKDFMGRWKERQLENEQEQVLAVIKGMLFTRSCFLEKEEKK